MSHTYGSATDSTVAHIRIGGEVRPTAGLRAIALVAPLLVMTTRLLSALQDELGSEDAVYRWIADLASETNKPIAVRFEKAAAEATTVIIGPHTWSREKLTGWLGGVHEELDRAFGPSELRGGPR